MYSRIKKSVHINLLNLSMSGSEETFKECCDKLAIIFDLDLDLDLDPSNYQRMTSYASELTMLPYQPNRKRDLEFKKKVLELVDEYDNASEKAYQEYLRSGDYSRNMMMMNRLRLYIGWCMCVLVSKY